MRTAPLLLGVVGVILVVISMRATAESALPDGPNRALVLRKCSSCHDVGLVVGTGGRTRDGWNGTIEDMMSYGMDITPAERGLVLEYLATSLPPG